MRPSLRRGKEKRAEGKLPKLVSGDWKTTGTSEHSKRTHLFLVLPAWNRTLTVKLWVQLWGVAGECVSINNNKNLRWNHQEKIQKYTVTPAVILLTLNSNCIFSPCFTSHESEVLCENTSCRNLIWPSGKKITKSFQKKRNLYPDIIVARLLFLYFYLRKNMPFCNFPCKTGR